MWDCMSDMHFISDGDEFDEVDCQYNNCQYGRWVSQCARNPEQPDRHLERNVGVKRRIDDAVTQRSYGIAPIAHRWARAPVIRKTVPEMRPK